MAIFSPKRFAAAIGDVARSARKMSWLTRHMRNDGSGTPISNEVGNLIEELLDFGSSNKMEYGYVVDAFPTLRSYRVQPEAGGPTLQCNFATHSACSPIGVYDANTLVAGTHVRFMRHKHSNDGIIMGIEPSYMYDPRKFFGDIISQGSNTSIRCETGYGSGPLAIGGTAGTGSSAKPLYGGITSWSGRTPWDSTEISEFNKSTETGLMLHMDPYMAFMRADELTGVWMYYWDGLLRIGGQQFQEWAGPTEREVLDDEGETSIYHGVGIYPWEHRGMLQGPEASTFYEFTDPEDIQDPNKTPYYARFEPTEDDTQPFHRFQTYGGYLGQGFKEIISAPNFDDAATTARYSSYTYQPVGLYEQQATLSGHWWVRTATGLTLAKRPIIPVPHRKAPATSGTGDTPDNYKASSYYGSGADHKVQATPTITEADTRLQAFQATMSVLDIHSNMFNWEGAHPFDYHANDFELTEDSNYTPVTANQEVPTFSDLATQWYLELPSYNEIQVDHRTGMDALRVYNCTQYLTFLDEGGVLLGDGWGSEIRMAGGTIAITCPGDVFLEAGRNVISWGGRDVIVRAKQSVDITASDKDVRIKAEENLWMLAANCGNKAKGMLFECRSTVDPTYNFTGVGQAAESNGFVFKAPNNEFVVLTKNIYLRTGIPTGKDNGSATPPAIAKAGDIVLDALGTGDVITRSEFVKHWVACAVMHSFPDTDSPTGVNFFTSDGCTLCGDVFTDGDLVSQGTHMAQGDFVSSGGHMYSANGGAVGKLTAASAASAADAISQGHTYETTLQTWSGNAWTADLDDMWYSANRPGSDTTIESMWFSLRIKSDYKSEYFMLPENRWQQMQRLNGDAAVTWTETAVATNLVAGDDQNTMPFPGYVRMYTDNARIRMDALALTDVASGGICVDRAGGTYEAPLSHGSITAGVIDGNYPIVG